MGDLVNLNFSYERLILANSFYIFAVEGKLDQLGTVYSWKI